MRRFVALALMAVLTACADTGQLRTVQQCCGLSPEQAAREAEILHDEIEHAKPYLAWDAQTVVTVHAHEALLRKAIEDWQDGHADPRQLAVVSDLMQKLRDIANRPNSLQHLDTDERGPSAVTQQL